MGSNVCLNYLRPVVYRFSTISPRCLSSSSAKTSPFVDVPEPPKRPLSPYLTFVVKKRSEIVGQNSAMKSTEIINQIASAWRILTPDNKKIYEDMWIKEVVNFKVRHAEWWKNLSAEQQAEFDRVKKESKEKKKDRRLKRQLRTLGKPRRPLNAFNFYMSTNMNNLKNKEDIPSKELFKKLACSWKDMSDEDKKIYADMEAKDLKKHGKELEDWKEKMQLNGHEDLIGTTATKKATSKPAKVRKEVASSDKVSGKSSGAARSSKDAKKKEP